MQNISLKADTLDEAARGFAQARLNAPLFLNSVPKSGSHLLRNILRMFVAPEQQYPADFIQHATLPQHERAFDEARPLMSWGHLVFSDGAAVRLAHSAKLLLVRDPYDWVLARTRFFLSDQMKGNLEFLKTGRLTIPELLNLQIFGIWQKLPPMAEIYMHNAAAWLGTDITLVRFEELRDAARDPAAHAEYFRALLTAARLEIPGDWAERVRIGSDPAQSGTARENLDLGKFELPATLPAEQRRLVDYAAPGLRPLLGYS